MLLVLLEDSIEYKKASQTKKHICKAFTRPKSFQTVVFLDWSRCWKSGSLLCVYPPDDRRRCRPSNECTEPNMKIMIRMKRRERTIRIQKREKENGERSFLLRRDFLKGPSRESCQNWNPFEKFVTCSQISLYIYFYPFLIIHRRYCTILSDEGIKRSTAA